MNQMNWSSQDEVAKHFADLHCALDLQLKKHMFDEQAKEVMKDVQQRCTVPTDPQQSRDLYRELNGQWRRELKNWSARESEKFGRAGSSPLSILIRDQGGAHISIITE